MSKAEADRRCMDLFGMNSDDYAKRILAAWKNRETTEDMHTNNKQEVHID